MPYTLLGDQNKIQSKNAMILGKSNEFFQDLGFKD